jgi:NADPH-dependent 2,4-dienoyl-CoA reductase/sulfur reductase-like enzyme/peroxiredoxin family protein/rhodanese-related sulfurtransferase/TusA-related sulfurtransferase
MKIVIVGGVAAGMSAAARLRRLDEQAEIVVFEKDEHVSFANCGLPYHIGGAIAHRHSLLVQTPESLKTTLNLDVRIFSEVVAIDRAGRTVRVRETRTGRTYDEPYDKLVLTPGAKSIRPPMPGLEHPAIFELRNIADMDRIVAKVKAGAKRAVVMGGYIGIEAAENLRQRGLEVVLVEKMPQIMGPLDPEMAHYLQEQLELHGIQVLTQAGVTGFRDEGGQVTVLLETGIHIVTDLVVFALGSTPNTDLAKAAGLQLGSRGGIAVNEHMQTSDANIFAGGDAVETVEFVSGQPVYIPMAGPANRQGRMIADNLCGRDSRYRGTQGTSVLKAFDLTVATTGLNEKVLKRAGIPFRKIYVHPFGHASYYPGTAQMHIKLLFSPDGKRILGAQIAGYDGVDKRIDVLATAMRGGLGVWDLEHLELAYAPPYGSAKDPVNMAGFTACNLLRGDVEFWYAEEFGALPANAVLLDVRTPNEFSAWHIPGAVNVPLGTLRTKADSLDHAKSNFIYCKVGLRSYLAYRILKQRGFTAKTLAGGGDIFRAVHPALGPATPPLQAAPPPVAPPATSPAGGRCAPTDCGGPAPAAPTPATSHKTITVDCMGLQCPGPLRKVVDALQAAAVGDELDAHASDAGFLKDMQAWCQANGHTFVAGGPAADGGVRCRIRKVAVAVPAAPATCAGGKHKKTLVVFSGDLDKVLAAFVIANGALAMGDSVTLFFTFWGLTALRREQAVAITGKSVIDRMFGWMLPRGLGKLKLSQMHMAGMGTAMMRHVMASKHVDSPQQLLAAAQRQGIRLVACSMSMDVMGLKPEELIDGVEIGGVASFLAEADQSNATLFV